MGVAPKRQDPNPNMGMVTVGKELPTHLHRELNIFGLLTGITPSQGKLPARGDEPPQLSTHENGPQYDCRDYLSALSAPYTRR